MNPTPTGENRSRRRWRNRLAAASVLAVIGGAFAVLPSHAEQIGGLTIAPETGGSTTPVTLTTDGACPSSAAYAEPYLLGSDTLLEVPLGERVLASTLPKAGNGFSLEVGTWVSHKLDGVDLAGTYDVWVDCVNKNGVPAGNELVDFFGGLSIAADGSWRTYKYDLEPAGYDAVTGSSSQTTTFTTGACAPADTHLGASAVYLPGDLFDPSSLSAKSAENTPALTRLYKSQAHGLEAKSTIGFGTLLDGVSLPGLPKSGAGYQVKMPDSWDGLADDLQNDAPLEGLLFLTIQCSDVPTFDADRPFDKGYIAALEFADPANGHSTFRAIDVFTGEYLGVATPTPTKKPTPTPKVTPKPTATPKVTPTPGGPLPSTTLIAACKPGAPVPAGYTLLTGTSGDDILVGTMGRDLIRGLAGDDTIAGLGGDDVLCGGTGEDLITGGNGNDLLRGEGGDDSIYGGAGNDRIDGGTDGDLLVGGLGNDLIAGASGPDDLYGGAGDDDLYGDGGNDNIYGEDGYDRLFGGPGRDYLQPAGKRA